MKSSQILGLVSFFVVLFSALPVLAVEQTGAEPRVNPEVMPPVPSASEVPQQPGVAGKNQLPPKTTPDSSYGKSDSDPMSSHPKGSPIHKKQQPGMVESTGSPETSVSPSTAGDLPSSAEPYSESR